MLLPISTLFTIMISYLGYPELRHRKGITNLLGSFSEK